MSWKVRLQQHALNDLGFGPLVVDGKEGPLTRAAYNNYVASRTTKPTIVKAGAKAAAATLAGYVPAPTPWGKIQTFGPHGVVDGYTPPMGKVNIPWVMFLYKDGGQRVKTISVHKLIVDPMQDFVNALYEMLGADGIRRYGFHLWFGCYNPRKSRGGSTMSDHAWAIANDWNMEANGNRTTWRPGQRASNGTYQFSEEIVTLAKKFGFTVGFANGSNRRDMMHFAYVNRK